MSLTGVPAAHQPIPGMSWSDQTTSEIIKRVSGHTGEQCKLKTQINADTIPAAKALRLWNFSIFCSRGPGYTETELVERSVVRYSFSEEEKYNAN